MVLGAEVGQEFGGLGPEWARRVGRCHCLRRPPTGTGRWRTTERPGPWAYQARAVPATVVRLVSAAGCCSTASPRRSRLVLGASFPSRGSTTPALCRFPQCKSACAVVHSRPANTIPGSSTPKCARTPLMVYRTAPSSWSMLTGYSASAVNAVSRSRHHDSGRRGSPSSTFSGAMVDPGASVISSPPESPTRQVLVGVWSSRTSATPSASGHLGSHWPPHCHPTGRQAGNRTEPDPALLDPTGYRARLAELPTVIRIITSLEFYRLGW